MREGRPDVIPEGDSRGLYHTADATLWFFHAVDCYSAVTGDQTLLAALLAALLPALRTIIREHLRGTRFGIGDSCVMIIGRSRWASDHVVVRIEQVAASGPDLVILSAAVGSVRPETAEPWPLPRDPVGNANGVDIEPLRAGMAEIEDERAGTAAGPAGDTVDAPDNGRARPDPPLPSPEHAWELERARMARVDAEVERRIAEELEDFDNGAGCALPTGEEVPRIGAGRDIADRPLPPRALDASQANGRHDRPGGFAATRALAAAPSSADPRASPRLSTAITRAATQAARGTRALEHFLRSAGFSRSEAKAIAAGGFHALASLVHRYRGAQRADRSV